MSIVGPRPAAVDQVDITRGGENAIAATVPCGLTSQSSLWDYIYGDQFSDEKEYNEKVLPIRLKLDVYYVKHTSFFGDIKLIIWTVLAILYTACGKYDASIILDSNEEDINLCKLFIEESGGLSRALKNNDKSYLFSFDFILLNYLYHLYRFYLLLF
jgi:hypothetical protein